MSTYAIIICIIIDRYMSRCMIIVYCKVISNRGNEKICTLISQLFLNTDKVLKRKQTIVYKFFITRSHLNVIYVFPPSLTDFQVGLGSAIPGNTRQELRQPPASLELKGLTFRQL